MMAASTPRNFGGGDGDFGGERGFLADLEQRMLLADRAILRHVASGLTHEPDGRVVDRLGLAGANEAGIWGRHERMNLAFFEGGAVIAVCGSVCARLRGRTLDRRCRAGNQGREGLGHIWR